MPKSLISSIDPFSKQIQASDRFFLSFFQLYSIFAKTHNVGVRPNASSELCKKWFFTVLVNGWSTNGNRHLCDYLGVSDAITFLRENVTFLIEKRNGFTGGYFWLLDYHRSEN